MFVIYSLNLSLMCFSYVNVILYFIFLDETLCFLSVPLCCKLLKNP